MSANNQDPYLMIPELGDLITLVSDTLGTITGRIIYRDESLIRLSSMEAYNKAVDFPLDPETGLFRESLSVTELIMHSKALFPQFARQLAVTPGTVLEFFSTDGVSVRPPAVVAKVIATDDEDAILLVAEGAEDAEGERLAFNFVGPTPPLAVIVPRAGDDATEPNNNAASETANTEEVPDEEEPENFPEIDFSLLPAALVEEIPTAERTYSDVVQRESMFVSLLMDIPAGQQKNPRVLRNVYRKTDLLMALKNSVILRDETGGVVLGERRSYEAATLQEALTKQPTGAPLSALLPVAAVKKVVYVEEGEPEDRDHIQIRGEADALLDTLTAMHQFEGAGAQGLGNPFLTYLDTLLNRSLPQFVPLLPDAGQARITMDQDVLRSVVPPEPVEGFQSGLPSLLQKEPPPITTDYLTGVDERTGRLLAGTTLRNTKTGQTFQLSQGDVATTVAHILLSPDLEAHRAPTRSSVLLWDMLASQASRSRTLSFYALLRANWMDQTVVGMDIGAEGETETLAEIVEARMSNISAVAFRDARIVHTLDGLGLKSLELTEPVLACMVAAVERGRAEWQDAMEGLRTRARAALEAETPQPIFPAVAADAPLWTDSVLQHPVLADALRILKAREVHLWSATTPRTAFLLGKANHTLATVWYLLANQATEVAVDTAIQTYMAERRRLDRAMETERYYSAAIKAAPEINTCPHVYMLESIRAIRDEDKRMALLDDFVSKYKAGQRGNWIICGSCDKHLLCRHEILLLNEFQHPGRGSALHKALLLEFSGPVFEGAYICKNCGQKIADLEYDTHLEYDDDGKPLVGRTVVDPTATADEDDLDLAVGLDDEGRAEDTLGYEGADVEYFYLTRTVLEHCGIVPTREMYDLVIPAVRDFMNVRVFSMKREVYVARRDQMAKTAKKGQIIPPPYETYVSNYKIGAVGACIILMLLTQDVAIPFPAIGCKWIRGGFPLDADGSGTLTYVGCVIAGISRETVPWKYISWMEESSIPKRQQASEGVLRNVLISMLSIPNAEGRAVPPLTTVTDMFQTRLQATRDRRLESQFEESETGASRADVLPHQFRPAPVFRTEGIAEGVRNVEIFLRDAEEAPVSEIAPVVQSHELQRVQDVMAGFHTSALTSAKSLGALTAANPRSDGVCCFQRLGVAAARGMGWASMEETLGDAAISEIHTLGAAAARIRERDAAATANGSHFMVPWSAPLSTTVLPEADASMYYLLFLKHCFRGDRMGDVHEIGEDSVCRHCMFRMPPALTYMTVANIAEQDPRKLTRLLEEQTQARKQLALQAFSEQGVTLDETAFRALEDAIRARKTVTPVAVKTPMAALDLLARMLEGLRTAPLLSTAVAEWERLQKAMATIYEKELPESPQRRRDFSVFTVAMDGLRAAVEARFGDLLGPRPTAEQRAAVQKAMEGLTTLTESMRGGQAARNILYLFALPGEQVATDTLNVNPNVSKWFKSISRSHKALLYQVWDTLAASQRRGTDALERLSTDAQVAIRRGLRDLAGWLGGWMRLWLTEARGTTEILEDEGRDILRWALLHAIAAMLSENSPLYAQTSPNVRREMTGFFMGWLLDILKTMSARVATYHMTPQQIQDALLARTEAEKRIFIKRFDKLDQDMRKVELIKKNLKIGDWAVGNVKNLFHYDADFFEFERAQRAEMGVPDFEGRITGAEEGGAAENPFGFYMFGEVGPSMHDNDHRDRQDEDE